MTTSTTAPAASTDRIERSIHIQAPKSRVWRAVANAEEFGTWFGADLTGKSFAPGQGVQAPITMKGCEHIVFDVVIERVEPEDLIAYRWHPYTPDADYSKEERTLVTLTLSERDGGTLVTVVETGFDKIPPARRARAFSSNSNGWEFQLKNIAQYASAG
ncbi:MAG: SRPBCC family protein [Polaromonas sp.]|nr:SRPBCC family protein [Polaromonas sp.]